MKDLIVLKKGMGGSGLEAGCVLSSKAKTVISVQGFVIGRRTARGFIEIL